MSEMKEVCVGADFVGMTAVSAEIVVEAESTTASTLAAGASVAPTSKRFFLTAADAVSERIKISKKTIDFFKMVSSGCIPKIDKKFESDESVWIFAHPFGVV